MKLMNVMLLLVGAGILGTLILPKIAQNTQKSFVMSGDTIYPSREYKCIAGAMYLAGEDGVVKLIGSSDKPVECEKINLTVAEAMEFKQG